MVEFHGVDGERIVGGEIGGNQQSTVRISKIRGFDLHTIGDRKESRALPRGGIGNAKGN